MSDIDDNLGFAWVLLFALLGLGQIDRDGLLLLLEGGSNDEEEEQHEDNVDHRRHLEGDLIILATAGECHSSSPFCSMILSAISSARISMVLTILTTRPLKRK